LAKTGEIEENVFKIGVKLANNRQPQGTVLAPAGQKQDGFGRSGIDDLVLGQNSVDDGLHADILVDEGGWCKAKEG